MVTFPLKAAAVDIGSNAIRLYAAEFRDQQEYAQIISDRYPVRMGHNVFLTGRLSDEVIASAVDALKKIRVRLQEGGITRYRAVATAAVRESDNGDEFVRKVMEEAGLNVETISGFEEARLIHRAVKHRLDLGNDQWMLVDLGGGSVEVSLIDANGILWSESHSMGSVRLLEELGDTDRHPGRFNRIMTEYIATLRVPSLLRNKNPAGFIATGGNIESLAKLGGTAGERGVLQLRMQDLRLLLRKLMAVSYHERIRQFELREDRADVILPAGLVYDRIAELVGADKIIVPQVGLKEGILLDLVDGLQDHEPLWEKQTLESAVTLGRKYLFDEQHAVQVARIALSLFDQLKQTHGLNEKDRQMLLASAILHDIGGFISYKKHHKHSMYIISQSELPSFSPAEMRMIANVARYHRKSVPQTRHAPFAELDPQQQERVARMTTLLRMADAMDREHLQKIKAVRIETGNAADDGRVLILHLQGTGDLLLERWALRSKSQFFSDKFNTRIELKIER
jgi:exopolyphosphatase/guanosine-5'-triphosphate,3'-diphosphate pyrophosphatase